MFGFIIGCYDTILIFISHWYHIYFPRSTTPAGLLRPYIAYFKKKNKTKANRKASNEVHFPSEWRELSECWMFHLKTCKARLVTSVCCHHTSVLSIVLTADLRVGYFVERGFKREASECAVRWVIAHANIIRPVSFNDNCHW